MTSAHVCESCTSCGRKTRFAGALIRNEPTSVHICYLRYFRLALPIFLSLPAKEKSIVLDNEGGNRLS